MISILLTIGGCFTGIFITKIENLCYFSLARAPVDTDPNTMVWECNILFSGERNIVRGLRKRETVNPVYMTKLAMFTFHFFIL